MHVIRDKKTTKILHIDYSRTDSAEAGKDVYQGFDADSMEIGWTAESYIPAWFDIDKKGLIRELDLDEAAVRGLYQLEPGQKLVDDKIVDMDNAELIDAGLLQLDDMKQQMREYFNALSFQKRQEIIPDYKLNNASLGVYDEQRIADYRVTIQAFRDEAKRITASIDDATGAAELEAIEAGFPSAILSAE